MPWPQSFYLQVNGMLFCFEANHGCRASRMTMDVAQGLLHDPEYGGFHFRGKPLQGIKAVKFHPNAASLAELLDVPAQGGSQATLVKQGRVEQVRNRSDTANRFLGHAKLPGNL